MQGDALPQRELSIQGIASRLGYNDYNYFCKDFKKNFGMSAKEYSLGCKIK